MKRAARLRQSICVSVATAVSFTSSKPGCVRLSAVSAPCRRRRILISGCGRDSQVIRAACLIYRLCGAGLRWQLCCSCLLRARSWCEAFGIDRRQEAQWFPATTSRLPCLSRRKKLRRRRALRTTPDTSW